MTNVTNVSKEYEVDPDIPMPFLDPEHTKANGGESTRWMVTLPMPPSVHANFERCLGTLHTVKYNPIDDTFHYPPKMNIGSKLLVECMVKNALESWSKHNKNPHDPDTTIYIKYKPRQFFVWTS